VSGSVRDDVIRCYPGVDPARVSVVHNGIDPDEWHPDDHIDALERHGVDPGAPTVIFVGRVTRQKGITHLLDAVARLDTAVQLVLRAGSPDRRALAAGALQAERGNVVWIEYDARAPRRPAAAHADVFCCLSIYEPLGLVNLRPWRRTAVVARRRR
jgi:starch synthase